MGEYSLVFHDPTYAICKLPVDDHFPQWAAESDLLAYIRTPYELTIVCEESLIPEGVTKDSGWSAIYIDAVLDFNLVGVLLSLLNPLAAAGISIYALSTYSTDYILIRCKKNEDAKQVLIQAGFEITTQD